MYTDGRHITSLMCINVWCNKILSDETVIDTASCFSNFPRWPRPSAHALLLILTSLFWSWTLVIWLSPSWTVCSNVSHPTFWMYSCHLIEIALFLLWPLHPFKMFLDLRSKYTVFHNYPQYMLCYLKFAHRIHFFWLEIYHPFLLLFDWKPGFYWFGLFLFIFERPLLSYYNGMLPLSSLSESDLFFSDEVYSLSIFLFKSWLFDLYLFNTH